MTDTPDITPRQFLAGLLLILLVAIALRGAFPTADPPWRSPVGITWHDEGPWVHNARNKALWGEWSTDQWNPMYLAPVFTGLEYVAFESFGVGQWQARLVSMTLGTLAILFVAVGVAATASRRAALVAALLMACNHSWVQWNRVALLETTMVAFIAMSWGAYALAGRRPAWGAFAGVAAWLAFFSKASAAFYLMAIGLEAVTTVALGLRSREDDDRRAASAAIWTLAGLAVAAIVFLVLFAIPHWTEVRFYNWQMSVTRKPAYTIGALVSRASWVPVVNDFFVRLLPVAVLGLASALGLGWRWRTARPAERLLGLYVGLGLLEIIAHDAGNERRLLMFIPAFVALAAPLLAGHRWLVPAGPDSRPRRLSALMAPAVLYAAYLVCGAVARAAFAPSVQTTVWVGSAAAVAVTAGLYAAWPRLGSWLAGARIATPVLAGLLVIIVGADLVQYEQWAANRTYKNVTASTLIGRWLPPGTLVEGKLANGLSLDNRIRPIFVGHGFGNYDDRLRPDVRYILTYTSPRIGYEGSVILDVLGANPGWKVIHEFDVAETPGDHDRAALIQKP